MASYLRLLVLAFIAPVLCCGCMKSVSSFSEPRGKLEPASKGADQMRIEELEKNWRDYNVYYVGVEIGIASAALFDPKGDDYTLADTRKRWESAADGMWVEVLRGDEVKTEQEISRLINAIRVQRWTQYRPKLYRIIGSGGEFCGYLYTAWNWAMITSNNGTFAVRVNNTPPRLWFRS